MALFGRKGKGGATYPPDEDLPFFDTAEAGRFRVAFATAFREAGLEVDVFPGHVRDARGREFGMYNAATVCHSDDGGERAWPGLLRDHARRVLASMEAEKVELTQEQVLASVYPRLMDGSQGTGKVTMDYALPFADGILEVLNLDQPETVLYLNDETVAKHGGHELLRAAALKNLRAVLEQVEVSPLDHDGGHVDVVMGESLFTASLAVILPELLVQLGMAAEHGVFLAVPHRHQLCLHELRDGTLIPSLQLMAGFARAGYADGTGPVSPHAYWWHRGEVTRLTLDGDEGLRIEVREDLTEVMNLLVR